MKKTGYIILATVWPISYFFKYEWPIFETIVIDYYITIGYCIGMSMLAYDDSKKEKNKWAKHMFYYVITALGLGIVLTYSIDFIIDDLWGTSKLIWSIIIATFISLCFSFYKKR